MSHNRQLPNSTGDSAPEIPNNTRKPGAWTSQQTQKCLPLTLCQGLVACAWEWTRPWCRSIQQHHPNATSTSFSSVLGESRRGRKQKPGQNHTGKYLHSGGDPACRSTQLAHPRTQASFFKKAACGLKDLILIHHHEKPFQVGGKK